MIVILTHNYITSKKACQMGGALSDKLFCTFV